MEAHVHFPLSEEGHTGLNISKLWACSHFICEFIYASELLCLNEDVSWASSINSGSYNISTFSFEMIPHFVDEGLMSTTTLLQYVSDSSNCLLLVLCCCPINVKCSRFLRILLLGLYFLHPPVFSSGILGLWVTLDAT